jgi:RNA polymerase sigma factor (sigma-70 family)
MQYTLTNTNNVASKLVLSEVIKEYQSRLKAFIRKRVNSLEDAEDILQEVFYQLTVADTLMKPIDQVRSWLFTVARNRITDLYRKKKNDLLPDYFSDDEDEPALQELNAVLFDNGSTPETEYLRSIAWEEIEKAISELPDEQRLVFEMTEFQGKSFKDIAELTVEPVNTLISRKRYAVLYLRERLQVIYDELLNF